MVTPYVKRASKFKIKRPQSRRSRAPQPYQEEQIFCILNERVIFQTLKDSINEQSNNSLYYAHEVLDIYHFQMKTLLKSNLLESETDYLEFVEPLLDLKREDALGVAIECKAYRALFTLVQHLKENNFKFKFSSIFRATWMLVLKSQSLFSEGVQ